MGTAISCKEKAEDNLEKNKELDLNGEADSHINQKNNLNLHTSNQDLTERGNDSHAEIIVIGGGSAGFSCAMEAIELGFSVVVVNYVEPTPFGSKWGLGGTCLNVGCMPKYMFHQASEQIRRTALRGVFGVSEGKKGNYDWEKVSNATNNYIQSVGFQLNNLSREKEIKVYNYIGRFINERKIGLYKKWTSLKPSLTLSGDNFVLATGERPLTTIEGVEGLEFAVTTDDLFKLKKKPKTALVLGGGYIAAEVISILSGFGVKAKLYHRSELVKCKK